MQSKNSELQKEIDKEPNLGLFIFGFIELILLLNFISNFSQLYQHGVFLILAIIFAHLLSLLFVWGAGVFTKNKKNVGSFLGSLVFLLVYIFINACAIFLALMAGYSVCPSCT